MKKCSKWCDGVLRAFCYKYSYSVRFIYRVYDFLVENRSLHNLNPPSFFYYYIFFINKFGVIVCVVVVVCADDEGKGEAI